MVYNKDYVLNYLYENFGYFEGVNLVERLDKVAEELSGILHPRLGRDDYDRYDIKSDLLVVYFAHEDEVIEKLNELYSLGIESMYDLI